MTKKTTILAFIAWTALTMLTIAARPAAASTVSASDLDYGISAKQSNSFNFDFSNELIWTAGSQRSTNGSADASNQRSGRVFVDFQLDAGIIAAAQRGGTVMLTFTVDSIGQGVTGTPYTDGLDLRYFGVSASDRSASTYWGTGAIGPDQPDILATTGPVGTSSVFLTNPSVLAQLAAASPGQYIGFGFLNSVGTRPPAAPTTPVGNSTAQTYGFQMSLSTSDYSLSVVPEPASIATGAIAGLLLFGCLWVRRRSVAR